MIVELPVYVEEVRQGGQPRFSARALLLERGPVEVHRELERALARLAQRLQRELGHLGGRPRHQALLDATWSPPLAEELLELELVLRRRTVRGRFLFVSFPALDRRVAFTPTHPEVWFALERGQSLAARAREVLELHYRELERREALDLPEGARAGVGRRAWVTTLELSVATQQRDRAPPSLLDLLLLGASHKVDGAAELQRVGRCLDWLWPDELQRAVLREPQVEELLRLLDDRSPRAALLLGPSGAGKTAVLHEAVARRVEARGGRARHKRAVWVLSPQRLISGMSYVGQWEERLLAILEHARRRELVLVLDDLLGWWSAGQTSQSSLSAAQLLRPHVEQGRVRVVAELSPEGLRLLQETDRAFADLLQVVRVDEPPREDVARIAIRTLRGLEARHDCSFAAPALPAALELTDAWGTGQAAPGKVVALLRQVAARRAGQEVGRVEVLEAFQATSGLELGLLDPRQTLERRAVEGALRRELVGQPEAVAAMADVVLVAKARLRAPGRPLGVLLFLGPTGVGKTQAARTLARVLFGDAERLLRFDMNEFVSAWQVPRLVGTVAEPDGLLTSAVRRRPFSVLLLDEVEKAHPDALDLLLQVLGEGRLTDGRGRTADFGGTVIVLTSNLGAREGGAALGFGDDPVRARTVWQAAAERFFSPELLNRIDRLVPFARLERGQVERIARGLLEGLLRRDGLARRRALLRIDPRAMERVVDLGYDPDLGARALKRALERALVRPAAELLARSAPGAPVVISLFAGPGGQGGGELLVQASALEPAPAPAARGEHAPPAEELTRLEAALVHLVPPRPSRVYDPARITPAEQQALAAAEQARRVRERLQAVRERLAGGREARRRMHLLRLPAPAVTTTREVGGEHPRWEGLFAAEDLRAWIVEAARGVVPGPDDPLQALDEAAQELRLLEALLAGDPEGRWLLDLTRLVPGQPGDALGETARTLAGRWAAALEAIPGHTARLLPGRLLPGHAAALVVEGPAAGALLQAEAGVHLFLLGETGAPAPLQARLRRLDPGQDPQATLEAEAARAQAWVAALEQGQAGLQDDPDLRAHPDGRRLVRVYAQEGPALDLRSGAVVLQGLPQAEELRALLLLGLAGSGQIGSDP